MSDKPLVLYNQMRVAIKQCVAVDEIAGIKDQAAKLEAYARVRDDGEAQRQFAEIRLRACQRIGEISRDLEKADQAKGGRHPTEGKPTKTKQLAAAGISTSTANRYEEIAGPKEVQAEAIIGAATDAYFATQAEEKKPVNLRGLRKAVRGALETTFGKRKEKRRPSLEERKPDLLVHFLYSPRWRGKESFVPSELAGAVMGEFAKEDWEAATHYLKLLTEFIKHLERRFPYVTKS